jgi:hypothetical protein
MRYAIPILFCAFLLFSCGEKVKEAKNALNAMKSVAEAAENVGENMEEMNKKQEERIAKGDTIAMHYEELAKYLPESFNAFSKDGDLKGGTVNMSGASYSNVEQVYTNADGERLKIAIMDYNSAIHIYTGVMALYGTGLDIDNTNERLKSFTIDDEIKGWHTFKKKTNKVELFAGIANRFYVTVNLDNAESGDDAVAVITDTSLKELEQL